MASSSSVRPGMLTGSVNTSRHGAVARWWQTQKGDLVKDAIIGFLVGVVLFLGACWWDARLEARQDALSSAIANRQDDLARDLANQAEVLENTRFVRSIATSKEETPKPFASINLHGAELGGLNLGCNPRTLLGCADFRKADLQEANLTTASFAGAGFWDADLRKANLTGADFSAAFFKDANLDGAAAVQSAGFQGARMIRTTFVQSRLERASFSDATLSDVKADRVLLSHGDFRNAYLRRSGFNHADLRNANFTGAEMIHVDLTSADLPMNAQLVTDLAQSPTPGVQVGRTLDIHRDTVTNRSRIGVRRIAMLCRSPNPSILEPLFNMRLGLTTSAGLRSRNPPATGRRRFTPDTELCIWAQHFRLCFTAKVGAQLRPARLLCDCR